MKSFIVPILVWLLAAGAGGAIAAASTVSAPAQNSIDVQLGAYFPNTGDARFLGGQTQLTAGLDYNLASSSGSSPSATNAFFDYLSGSKNSGYVHSGGLGLEYRTVGMGFVGAGLGLYNTSVENEFSRAGSVTGAGGKVFAGLSLGSGIISHFRAGPAFRTALVSGALPGETAYTAMPEGSRRASAAAHQPMMIPLMKLIPGMSHTPETAARRYLQASEFGTDVSGQFFASAPKKLTGPIEAMRHPHLHDRTNQEAAWLAVVRVSGADVPYPHP